MHDRSPRLILSRRKPVIDFRFQAEPVQLAGERKTRRSILEAARTTFADLGYERATVRSVAQGAQIHSSLVIRYFGSKENLFLASVQFDLRLPNLRKVPSKKRGERLVRHFLETWEQGNTAAQLPALLRIALSHPNGKAHLETMFREQLEP